MQSYKLRKTSETALFPIEHELKLLRQESDKSWTTLMMKILAVVVSGIGTTLLCQEDFIPALVKYVFDNILKMSIPMGIIIVIELLLAVGVFALSSFIFVKVINWKNASKDNKKNDSEREGLAEFFHKVILNNIITGKSFTKKAQTKYLEMQKCISEMNKEEGKEGNNEKIKDIKMELCLYLSEALYYFMIAERQLREERIVEIGNRDKYLKFLKEVGILTVTESLLMYEKSVDELKKLLNELYSKNDLMNQERKLEDLSMEKSIEMIKMIKKSILDWKTNLKNTVKDL